MKLLINSVMTIVLLFSITFASAQIKNKKTEIIKILGNCEMCKKNIENAGNLKKVAIVNWDVNTKMAKLTYDSSKTNSDEILKRIADAGYENEKFAANDEGYNKLHACCQYDRNVLDTSKKSAKK